MHSPRENAGAGDTVGAATRPPLWLLTCGTRGSGKSALIVRLFDDAEAARAPDSAADYREYASAHRAFMVADSSGEALANVATHAELALLLVDADEGVSVETRRQALIARLMGVRRLVIAVNKIELVGFERTVFDDICGNLRGFAQDVGFDRVACIPVSARDGDNVVSRGRAHTLVRGPAAARLSRTGRGGR